MDFQVLGPLRVLGDDGTPLSLDSPKQRRLLAALLVAGGHAVGSDRLAEILWDDAPPADPAAALQTHVSRLRRALHGGDGDGDEDLPGPRLLTEPHGYRLRLRRGELDAERFAERLVTARRGDDPEVRLQGLRTALALWRGAAYEGYADADFATAEARRLEELRGQARQLHAEALMSLGRLDEAVVALEALAAAEPLEERPRALLMEAHYRAGRQGEALGVYQRYRRELSSELGLEPSPALSELEERVRRHELDPAAAPPAAQPATAAAAAGNESVPPPGPDLRISYLDAGGGGERRSIACGVAGSGPDLLVLPGFVSHLATLAAGRDPRSGFLRRLAEHARLLIYDRYGTGMSPGEESDFSPRRGSEEAAAVLAALQVGECAVLGVSASGPTAIELAARHPRRVRRLVLLGTYAAGPQTFRHRELADSVLSLVRASWGLGSKVLTDLMFPGAPPEFASLFARSQKQAASPETAALCLQAMYEADVAASLPEVAAPALVLHYTGDRAVPFQGGRDLAAGLPDARLVPLHGQAHLPTDADVDRVVELIAGFVSG